MKNKTLYTAIAALIITLTAVNLYIFTQPKPETQKACYKDLCLYSKQKPVEHIEQLTNNSNKSYLVFEGDMNKTELTSYVTKSTNEMIYALGRKTNVNNSRIHGIGYAGGKPIECGNQTVEYCQNLEPGQGNLLVKLKYPDYEENKVKIHNRTIEIQTKSGEDLLAAVKFLSNKFF